MCNLQNMQFTSCEICNACNLKHLHFAKHAFCNTCNLHHVQIVAHAICNICNLQHMQFATLAICHTCNLQHLQFASVDKLDRPAFYLKPWPVCIFEDFPLILYIVAASESDEGLVLVQRTHI